MAMEQGKRNQADRRRFMALLEALERSSCRIDFGSPSAPHDIIMEDHPQALARAVVAS
jgi:hypothetical protein